MTTQKSKENDNVIMRDLYLDSTELWMLRYYFKFEADYYRNDKHYYIYLTNMPFEITYDHKRSFWTITSLVDFSSMVEDKLNEAEDNHKAYVNTLSLKDLMDEIEQFAGNCDFDFNLIDSDNLDFTISANFSMLTDLLTVSMQYVTIVKQIDNLFNKEVH